MAFFLRFTENASEDLQRGHSFDFIAVTRDEAGLDEFATADKFGYELIENEMGVCSILPGLCGYELEAETLEEALQEAQEIYTPYGEIKIDRFSIFEGALIGGLPYGDGQAFKPQSILSQN